MIDHNVMRFDVSVHDALAVAEIESFEKLEDVVAYINVVELGVEAPEVRVVHVLEDERRSLALHGSHIYNPLAIIVNTSKAKNKLAHSHCFSGNALRVLRRRK